MTRVYNDYPEPWQMFFQDEATPNSFGITDLHNYILYYLIIIFIMVLFFYFFFSSSFFFSRERSSDWIRNNTLTHSTFLEFIWTVTPGLLLILFAIPSLKLLYNFEDNLSPQLTFKAIGNQWFWSFEFSDFFDRNLQFDSYTLDSRLFSYPDQDQDQVELGKLRLLDVDQEVYLPILTPIRLLVSAQDVIHSFFVPSFGLKIDSIPGRLNFASLFLLREGKFFGQCYELCGSGHERMSIVINAVPSNLFFDFLDHLSH